MRIERECEIHKALFGSIGGKCRAETIVGESDERNNFIFYGAPWSINFLRFRRQG
jgi:hypothetical protein